MSSVQWYFTSVRWWVDSILIVRGNVYFTNV